MANPLDNVILDAAQEINKNRIGGLKFNLQATLQSADSATPVFVVPKEMLEMVQPGGKVVVEGIAYKVQGTTAWAGVTTVKLQTTEGTPTDLVTIAVAGLTANASERLDGANVTQEAALNNIQAAGEGLQIVANADGSAGDDLLVTVWGVIKPA